MTDAETRAMQLFPPKYTAETWVRRQPDVNAPLRAAYIQGWKDRTRLVVSQHNTTTHQK